MEVLIPQEDLEVDGSTLGPREVQALYESELEKADVVIVVLDGIENEAWTGFECGYSRAHGKYIVGVRARDANANVPASRFTAMCDEIVEYDAAGDDWNASLAHVAQELGARILEGSAENAA